MRYSSLPGSGNKSQVILGVCSSKSSNVKAGNKPHVNLFIRVIQTYLVLPGIQTAQQIFCNAQNPSDTAAARGAAVQNHSDI